MIIKKTEVSIDLDNILPEELYLSVFSKKIIVKAVKKGAAKKSPAKKQPVKKGVVAKNKKVCNLLIVRL